MPFQRFPFPTEGWPEPPESCSSFSNPLGPKREFAPPLEPPPEDTERLTVVGRITHWLAQRWDCLDDSYHLEVYGVCAGTLPEWSAWLDTAPLAEVQRGLRLIEQEDAYLCSESPWRVGR
jgi:hypothetical protein